MSPGKRNDRDPYVEVCKLGRAAIETANQEKLGKLELKVLTAILHHTALRSKVGDHVYLAQIAAVAFATDDVQDWHLSKVRQALAPLRAAGCIHTKAPRGRHGTGRPRYWIGLGPCTEDRSGSAAPVNGASTVVHAPKDGARPRTDSDAPRTGKNGSTHRPPDPPRTAPRPPTEDVPSEGTEEGHPEGRAAHAASVTSGGDAGAGDGVPPVVAGPPPDDLAAYDPGATWIVSTTEAYVLIHDNGRPVLDYLDPRHHPNLATLTPAQRIDLLEDTTP